MPPKLKRCCVPGCKDRQLKRHRITKDPLARPIWLQRINNRSLFEPGVKFRNFIICRSHFKDNCFEASGKLRRFALPSLNLPGYESTQDDHFYKFATEPQNTYNPCEKLQKAITAIESSKSKDLDSDSRLLVTIPKRVYGKPKFINKGSGQQTSILNKEEKIKDEGLSALIDKPSTSEAKSVKTDGPEYSLEAIRGEFTPENQSHKNSPGEFEEVYLKTEDIDEFQDDDLVEPSKKRSKSEDTSNSGPKDENRLQRIIRLLEERLATVISENHVLRAQNQKLRKENDELRSSQELVKSNFDKTVPEISKKWSTDDMATALILESISPKAYRYLLNIRKMPLPSVPLLRNWIARTPINLDKLSSVMKLIRFKSKSISDDTTATVLCLQDINNSKNGQSCQIVMARGLFKSWSQLVYCAYNTLMTKDLLLLIITELYKVGFTVVAVVYDFSVLYNIFEGSNYLKQCWFEHPVKTDLRVFAFADPRYILNMLRDHFIISEFSMNGYSINKNIIKKILQTNSSELNISEKHISDRNLNDIKLAEDLLSSNVADVLSSCAQQDLPCAQAAEMVKTINQWYNLFQRDIKDGFGCDISSQIIILYNTTKFINMLKVDDYSKMNDCLKAILRNNKSLPELYLYLQPKYKVNIPTKNLSRDVIDDLLFYVSPVDHLDNQDEFIVKSRFTNYITGCFFSTGLDSNNPCVIEVPGEVERVEESNSVKETIETPNRFFPYEEITIKTESEEMEDL